MVWRETTNGMTTVMSSSKKASKGEKVVVLTKEKDGKKRTMM